MRLGTRAYESIYRTVATILLLIGMVVVMTPLAWMLISALKSQDAVNTSPPQSIPTEQIKVNINGQSLYLYDIEVNGVKRQLALLNREGSLGTFVDPAQPDEQYQLPVASGARATRVY